MAKFNPKNPQEIEIMKIGGAWSAEILKNTMNFLKVGMTTLEVDEYVEKQILARGAESSFKKVPGYHHSTCICINEQIVHTPPSKQKIKEGDLVCVDLGVYYKGYHTDVADTRIIGTPIRDAQAISSFLEVGKKTLELAILEAQDGAPISNISRVISREVNEKAGYYVVPELTGHGVGKELHEAPFIPGVVTKESQKTKLIAGMTIAIEIIYAQSKCEIIYEDSNHWSLISSNKCLTSCVEKTILVTDTIPLVITNY